ncbi:MAG: 2,3-bisphosphoglycerate-independent phosphoglycerate mutase [Rhizobacter sp.]|nr:2,3-bisphosphoglycerate-independent phosphoglycerate mutase [Bacteriovorax sp.]
MKSIQGLSKRVLLCILDGYGITQKDLKNAIFHAKKPNLDAIMKDYPMTTIEPGGELVGLPKGVVGNSEVGHMNLGAGRAVRQDLVRINEAIEEGTLADMPEMKNIAAFAKAHSNRIHLMGLLSNGGVHSHINHLKELCRIFSAHNIELVLHAFTDGRDTARDSGIKFVEEAMNIPGLKFGSMQGRSIGMDRDRRWNKIEHAYKTFIGQGEFTTLSPLEYLKSEYAKEHYDEFVTPVMFDKNLAMTKEDAVLFFNYRPDRAIQITLALTDNKFTEFFAGIRPGYFLCMTPYVEDWVKLPILFNKEKLDGTLCQYLSEKGLKQFKIAETEKYAHVTFFFNGGDKHPFKNEDQVLISSPKDVATYDEKPEMSAFLVCDRLEEALKDHSYSFYVVNFANSDMVGHTGNFPAAIKAIEVLDVVMGRLVKTAAAQGVTILMTADHGNSEQMIYENGDMHTAHTDSVVPFVVIDPKVKNELLELSPGTKALRDVAPTILNIMGLPQAPLFEGVSIFK